MAFCSIKPSIDLHSSCDLRKFSHVSGNQREAGVQTDHSCQIDISRDVYTQQDVDEIQSGGGDAGTKETDAKRKLTCPTTKSVFSAIQYVLPLIGVIRNYDFKQYIIGDFLSGISVACLHFPQGLAYGILASLSPVQGLYTSFFPVLFYVLFGTVQHMAIGTDSIVAIMLAEIIETEASEEFRTEMASGNFSLANNKDVLSYKTGVSMKITLACGLILVVMAVLRLGFLTTYQSKSFIGGFTTAAAFHIFTSQVPKALGITVPLTKGIGKMVKLYVFIFENVGETNLASVILVTICVIFILFIKDFINARYRERLKFSVPADLIAIILATVVSRLANLHDNYGIELVGDIPSGVPAPGLPDTGSFSRILAPSLEIAVLIFFLSIAMVSVCAEKHEYEVEDNRELLAYGLTNLACSLFPCFPPSTSPPRNMILSNMGARTTVSGVFTALLMLLVLLVLGELFASLPVPALAAMIFVSVKPLLLQVTKLRQIFRINKIDFIVWVVSCLTGVLMDLPYGLILGVGTSFITVVIQNQMASVTQLFYRSDHHLFVTTKTTPTMFNNRSKPATISVFRLNTSLYFATSDRFRQQLYQMTVNPLQIPHTSPPPSAVWRNNSVENFKHSDNATTTTTTTAINTLEISNESQSNNAFEHRSQMSVNSSANDAHTRKIIVIDCSCVAYIDIQGVNTLEVVFEEYRRIGVTVLLARCGATMLATLDRAGFFDNVSKERVFYELYDAFQAAKLLLE